jgi:hypothetical protein
MELERWAVIGDFPEYEVSDRGRVRRRVVRHRTPAGRLLKLQVRASDGRVFVRLQGTPKAKTRRVHRLVAAAFLGPCPDGFQVNHRDGNPQNNTVANLEWATRDENMAHAVANGLMRSGEMHGLARLSDEDVATIRRRCATGERQWAVGADYGITQGQVSNLVRMKRRNPALIERRAAYRAVTRAGRVVGSATSA